MTITHIGTSSRDRPAERFVPTVDSLVFETWAIILLEMIIPTDCTCLLTVCVGYSRFQVEIDRFRRVSRLTNPTQPLKTRSGVRLLQVERVVFADKVVWNDC